MVRDWMPAILKQKFDISQGMAGVSATLTGSRRLIVGASWAARMADRWMRRHPSAGASTSARSVWPDRPRDVRRGRAPTLAVAVGLLVLFGFGWGFFDCNNMPILSQVVRPELRATGYGVMNMVSISGGGLADWGFAQRERTCRST